MTLNEFAREVGNRLDTFVTATRADQAEGADGFVGDRYERRTFEDWMAEFDAFEGLRTIAAAIKQQRLLDRRKTISLVERRQVV
jgi:hypothetical protein